MQTPEPAGFLESHLALVESVVVEVARRQRLSDYDLGEFRSLAFVKLIEHDYAVLRQFKGASSLRTYLTVVLQRVLLDHRNREWGRWRPSAAATRLGPGAIRLERLVTRDGFTAEEAIAACGDQGDISVSAEFLEKLRGRGPGTRTRATLGEEAIPDCVDPAPGPDARAEHRERTAGVAAVRRGIQDALQCLDSQDHLIITLRFRDGLSVADVARVLGLDAKPLYRRIERILAELRVLLSADASCAAQARALVFDTWCDWVPSGESGWWGPSNQESGSACGVDGGVARGDLSGRGTPGGVH